jgi:hypothetical protein
MTRNSWCLWVVCLCAGLLLASSAVAAERKGKDKKPGAKAEAKAPAKTAENDQDEADEADATAEDTPESQMITRLSRAYELAELGRQSKAPEALIAAARMLRELPPIAMEATRPTTESKDGPAAQEERGAEPKSQVEEASDWLKEAKALAQELTAAKTMTPEQQAAVAALAQRVEDIKLTRGAKFGPHCYWNMLKPGRTDTYKVKFVKGQPARVWAQANTKVRLDVKDKRDAGIHPQVIFVPKSGDDIAIKITNLGPVPAQYRVFTN